jgi:hypothetical protein
VRIDTESAARSLPTADDGPQSVIHAPKGFKGFGSALPTHLEDPNSPNDQVVVEAKRSPPLPRTRSTSSPSGLSENTVTSVASSTARGSEHHEARSIVTYVGSTLTATQFGTKETAPINTSVPPSRHGAGSTPRASTAEEAEAEWQRKRGRHSRNLSGRS